MNWESHVESCMKEFGEGGAEYHKWMDQYANGPTNHDHRKVLHHKQGVEVGVMLFGEKAKKFLIQHLIDDGIILSEKEEVPDAWLLYDTPGFLPYMVFGEMNK